VINDAVGAISSASRAGTSFVFGYLGGGPLPFDLKAPGADFILAFQALPIVLVMSVLTTLLFYWRILPPVVRGMAWLLERTLGVGGAVGLSPPTSFSAWWSRRCSSGPISRSSPAASCSW
jgi:CNT family concentrative nucleoside transporter